MNRPSDVPTRLGLVVALPDEARCLAGRRAIPGELIVLAGGHLLKIAGMGPERARLAAVGLLAHGATALVSFGCAGALHDALTPGMLVVPARVQLPNGSALAVTASWRLHVLNSLTPHFPLHTGALAHSDRVLTTVAQKKALGRQTQAVAVDMESAGVGAVAASRGVPWLVLRAIADDLNTTLPPWVPAALDDAGRPQPLRFARGLLRRPMDLAGLLRVGRGFARSRRTLREVSDRLAGVAAPGAVPLPAGWV